MRNLKERRANNFCHLDFYKTFDENKKIPKPKRKRKNNIKLKKDTDFLVVFQGILQRKPYTRYQLLYH